MFKKAFCIFACCVLLCVAFNAPLNVFADSEVNFSLEDVSTEKNRIVKTRLWVSDEVASFVADVSFDENALEFREAKALSSEAVLSVNESTKGEIKIAFLCESDTSGYLLELSFKAQDTSTKLSLEVSQVINTAFEDLNASCKGAEISVTAKQSQENSSQNEKDESESEDAVSAEVDSSEITAAAESSEVPDSIKIPQKATKDLTLILCVVGGVVVIIAVAVLAFFIGRKSKESNKFKK